MIHAQVETKRDHLAPALLQPIQQEIKLQTVRAGQVMLHQISHRMKKNQTQTGASSQPLAWHEKHRKKTKGIKYSTRQCQQGQG